MTGAEGPNAPLQFSAELFHALTELSPDVISIVERDGRLRYNSSAAERIHGYTQQEMIGRNTMELIHPDDREKVGKELAQLLERPKNLASVQYRYRNKDGRYLWMEAVAINELENPEIRGVITISRDISLRKKLEEDLRRALMTRDEFISVASHELKTPLTALVLQLQYISRLSKNPDISHTIAPLADKAIATITRLNFLVSDLLDVTRMRERRLVLEKSRVDLKTVLENMLSLMSEEIAKSGNDKFRRTANQRH